MALTYQGPSFFSTNGCRYPPRFADHDSPVIAHSNPQHDLDLLVGDLRKNWPHVCNAIFAPWDIRSFFDEYDFVRLGGQFLYMVIQTIENQNLIALDRFTKSWSENNQTGFTVLGDSACTVDIAFSAADHKNCGRWFLEKALERMKDAYHRAASMENVAHAAKINADAQSNSLIQQQARDTHPFSPNQNPKSSSSSDTNPWATQDLGSNPTPRQKVMLQPTPAPEDLPRLFQPPVASLSYRPGTAFNPSEIQPNLQRPFFPPNMNPTFQQQILLPASVEPVRGWLPYSDAPIMAPVPNIPFEHQNIAQYFPHQGPPPSSQQEQYNRQRGHSNNSVDFEERFRGQGGRHRKSSTGRGRGYYSSNSSRKLSATQGGGEEQRINGSVLPTGTSTGEVQRTDGYRYDVPDRRSDQRRSISSTYRIPENPSAIPSAYQISRQTNYSAEQMGSKSQSISKYTEPKHRRLSSDLSAKSQFQAQASMKSTQRIIEKYYISDSVDDIFDLFVRGVPLDADEGDLLSFFQSYARVASIHCTPQNDSQYKHCRLRFPKTSELKKVLSISHFMLRGLNLIVETSMKDRTEHDSYSIQRGLQAPTEVSPNYDQQGNKNRRISENPNNDIDRGKNRKSSEGSTSNSTGLKNMFSPQDARLSNVLSSVIDETTLTNKNERQDLSEGRKVVVDEKIGFATASNHETSTVAETPQITENASKIADQSLAQGLASTASPIDSISGTDSKIEPREKRKKAKVAKKSSDLKDVLADTTITVSATSSASPVDVTLNKTGLSISESKEAEQVVDLDSITTDLSEKEEQNADVSIHGSKHNLFDVPQVPPSQHTPNISSQQPHPTNGAQHIPVVHSQVPTKAMSYSKALGSGNIPISAPKVVVPALPKAKIGVPTTSRSLSEVSTAKMSSTQPQKSREAEAGSVTSSPVKSFDEEPQITKTVSIVKSKIPSKQSEKPVVLDTNKKPNKSRQKRSKTLSQKEQQELAVDGKAKFLPKEKGLMSMQRQNETSKQEEVSTLEPKQDTTLKQEDSQTSELEKGQTSVLEDETTLKPEDEQCSNQKEDQMSTPEQDATSKNGAVLEGQQELGQSLKQEIGLNSQNGMKGPNKTFSSENKANVNKSLIQLLSTMEEAPYLKSRSLPVDSLASLMGHSIDDAPQDSSTTDVPSASKTIDPTCSTITVTTPSKESFDIVKTVSCNSEIQSLEKECNEIAKTIERGNAEQQKAWTAELVTWRQKIENADNGLMEGTNKVAAGGSAAFKKGWSKKRTKYQNTIKESQEELLLLLGRIIRKLEQPIESVVDEEVCGKTTIQHHDLAKDEKTVYQILKNTTPEIRPRYFPRSNESLLDHSDASSCSEPSVNDSPSNGTSLHTNFINNADGNRIPGVEDHSQQPFYPTMSRPYYADFSRLPPAPTRSEAEEEEEEEEDLLAVELEKQKASSEMPPPLNTVNGYVWNPIVGKDHCVLPPLKVLPRDNVSPSSPQKEDVLPPLPASPIEPKIELGGPSVPFPMFSESIERLLPEPEPLLQSEKAPSPPPSKRKRTNSLLRNSQSSPMVGFVSKPEPDLSQKDEPALTSDPGSSLCNALDLPQLGQKNQTLSSDPESASGDASDNFQFRQHDYAEEENVHPREIKNGIPPKQTWASVVKSSPDASRRPSDTNPAGPSIQRLSNASSEGQGALSVRQPNAEPGLGITLGDNKGPELRGGAIQHMPKAHPRKVSDDWKVGPEGPWKPLAQRKISQVSAGQNESQAKSPELEGQNE